MDYSISWKYIVDKMRDKYGISPDNEEKVAFGKITALMLDIWDDYFDRLYAQEMTTQK